MKYIFFALLLFIITTVQAQVPERSKDNSGNVIIKGFIQKADLGDSTFKWFAKGQQSYTPDAATVAAFRAQKDSVHILAFGGTWCGDTKEILPHVMEVLDSAGWAANRFTLVGVDRAKKAQNNLTEIFGVTHVPTFILFKNGKEIGRTVEYGKIGMPERELAQMLMRKP